MLTLISAVVATVYWLGTYAHTPIGGWHGKLGLATSFIAVGHAIKRGKFFGKGKIG